MGVKDKMAKSAFQSQAVQKSWETHINAFGPILENAFKNNEEALVHLVAALNTISNRNFDVAVKELNRVRKYCKTPEDEAAWHFCVGLYAEMAGDTIQMIAHYGKANEQNHSFYLPYYKMATYYLSTYDYEKAKENYDKVIQCLQGELSEREATILKSAYTNKASCLMMMQFYEEALECLQKAKEFGGETPGILAIEAGLYALFGEKERIKGRLNLLKFMHPLGYQKVEESVYKILERKDPKFFVVPIEQEQIDAFWGWFLEYEEQLREKLDAQEHEAVTEAISEQLLLAFPFVEETPCVDFEENDENEGNEEKYVIILKDMYVVAIMHAYKMLLEACPNEILNRWKFKVIH